MTLQLNRPTRDVRASNDRQATLPIAVKAVDDADHAPHPAPASIPTDLTLAGTWGY